MTTIKVYGADWCGDCRRTKSWLDAQKVKYEYIDLVARPDQKEVAVKVGKSTHIPVVLFADGSTLVEPTNSELASKLAG